MSTKKITRSPKAQQTDALNLLIVDAIQDIKGKDIVEFNLARLEEASTDSFIVCHATSNPQMLGIINNIEKRVFNELGLRPNHVEGKGTGWMLIDYFSVIVHVFTREKRDFYNIEGLWRDAAITKYDDID